MSADTAVVNGRVDLDRGAHDTGGINSGTVPSAAARVVRLFRAGVYALVPPLLIISVWIAGDSSRRQTYSYDYKHPRSSRDELRRLSNESGGGTDEEEEDTFASKASTRTCGHGRRFRSGATETNDTVYDCECHPGWQRAGITDTFEFLEGLCSQYACESAASCRQATGVVDATCPVKGWNCLCPFQFALEGSLMGRETFRDIGGSGSGGRCMGLLYYASVRGTQLCEEALSRGWFPFLILAASLIPFGHRRTRCTHLSFSILNLAEWLRLGGRMCDGYCATRCTVIDEFAWSLYAVELAVWVHLLVFALWLSCFWTWCVAVWLLVAITLVVVIVVSVVAGALGLGGDVQGCGECNSSADCSPCGDCWPCALGGDASDTLLFLYYPGGGGIDTCTTCPAGCSDGRDCAFCRCLCCYSYIPVLFVISLLPRMPLNLWGGLIGRLIGTHVATESGGAYEGGSCLVDALACRSSRGEQAAYENEDWRVRVHSFLIAEADAERPSVPPAQSSMLMGLVKSRQQLRGGLAPPQGRSSFKFDLGGIPAYVMEGCLDCVSDACAPNTFEDYESGTCWICRLEDLTAYDKYTCGHIFCASCSDQMLSRRMPCPLCRASPSLVLRVFSVPSGPR